MAIKQFTYPLKGNNDIASIRTKELALEAFLNSLDLSDDPDDPNHNHDSSYAPIAHTHPASSHEHEQYLMAAEGSSAPVDPDIGDLWIETDGTDVIEINTWTSDGWFPMGAGGAGGGPHNRHPDEIVIYESASDVDQWVISYNPGGSSLDFEYVG